MRSPTFIVYRRASHTSLKATFRSFHPLSRLTRWMTPRPAENSHIPSPAGLGGGPRRLDQSVGCFGDLRIASTFTRYLCSRFQLSPHLLGNDRKALVWGCEDTARRRSGSLLDSKEVAGCVALVHRCLRERVLREDPQHSLVSRVRQIAAWLTLASSSAQALSSSSKARASPTITSSASMAA